MTFEWTDRQGIVHQLVSPALIDEEVATVSSEIDRALASLAHADPTRKAELRQIIRSRVVRLQQLRVDGERWNALAIDQIRVEAAALSREIQQLDINARPIVMIAVLHDEHERLLADTANRTALLAGEMTKAQRMAIAHSTIEAKPAADATRGEVHEWLKGDPVLYRPRTDQGGWFDWQDNDGGHHRLVSPLRIEREIAHIVHNLRNLLPSLREGSSHNETVRAIESANAVTLRLSDLQGDLDRYIDDAQAREDEEWQKFEEQWNARRGRQ